MAENPIAAEKVQYLNVFEREKPTTMKVLRAYPADKAAYKPHERSSTALQLAWTFTLENTLVMAALKGPLSFSGGFPPPPPTFQEVLDSYDTSSKELVAAVASTDESRLIETIAFPSGPKQMGEMRVIDFAWMMLMDSIHHRGQLSVYIRPAGGRVPSIYGPSGDEPWT